MDAIDRAVKNGLHITEKFDFKGQRWEDFCLLAANKQIILFGVGAGTDFFYRRYNEDWNVIGAVDNDPNLWGLDLRSFVLDFPDTMRHNVSIYGMEFLDTVSTDDAIILITGLKSYEKIAMQIHEKYCFEIFSVLHMEINYRRENNILDSIDLRQKLAEKMSQMPIRDNLVVIRTARDGEGHGKAIAEKLVSGQRDLDVVWIVRDMSTPIPQGVRAVYQKDSLEIIRLMSTAKVWLTDTGMNLTGKRNNQYCVQMKHWSSITLKMFGYDELKWRNEKNPAKFGVQGFDGIDYILVGSKFDEKTCRSGFRFKGDAVYVGSPRSDILFHTEQFSGIREHIEKIHPQIKGKKLALYAPTFRLKEKGSIENTYEQTIDFSGVKHGLEEQFGGKWIILLRLHPFVKNMSKEVVKPPFVFDVSDYYDGENLVCISDVLITDYSSIMFEPAFVKRPVFLFADDRKQYLQNERGFLIDYDTLPFSIAESNEELADNIENFDYDKYVRDVDTFMGKYGVHEDGYAGERAAKFILDLLDGKVHKGNAKSIGDYAVVECG